MKLKKVTFEGWKNCIEIKNGNFKLIVTTEVGPRIIGAFYGNSKNLFFVDPKLAGKKGGKEWVNYGGHRLWHSPETRERTYEPDNVKVDVAELVGGGLEFITPPNAKTGISKSLAIIPAEEETFQIVHTIRNSGVWEIEAAAWGITVMAPGGTALMPQNQNETQLLPTSFYSLWPYTRMNDPRIVWGDKFLLVKQDPKAKGPAKIGFNCEDGWIGYVNQNIAFIKQFIHDPDEDYPDNGCSVECYTNADMLEIETLSPLQLLEPGDEIQHIELWSALPANGKISTEADADALFGSDICGCEDDDCCCGHHHHEESCCCEEEKPKTKEKKKAACKKSSAKAEKKAPAKTASKKTASGKSAKKTR